MKSYEIMLTKILNLAFQRPSGVPKIIHFLQILRWVEAAEPTIRAWDGNQGLRYPNLEKKSIDLCV